MLIEHCNLKWKNSFNIFDHLPSSKEIDGGATTDSIFVKKGVNLLTDGRGHVRVHFKQKEQKGIDDHVEEKVNV